MRKFLIVVAVVVVVIVALGFVLPTKAHAEADIVVRAPPDAIMVDVATLKAWQEWTAWNTREDPSWNPFYSGAESGAGSTSTWTSSSTGPGAQTIVEADAQHVRYIVDAGPVHVDGTIAMSPDAAGTRVTWSDEIGVKSFGMRYLVPLIGPATTKDMNASLAKLKERAETRAGAPR